MQQRLMSLFYLWSWMLFTGSIPNAVMNEDVQESKLDLLSLFSSSCSWLFPLRGITADHLPPVPASSSVTPTSYTCWV